MLCTRQWRVCLSSVFVSVLNSLGGQAKCYHHSPAAKHQHSLVTLPADAARGCLTIRQCLTIQSSPVRHTPQQPSLLPSIWRRTITVLHPPMHMQPNSSAGRLQPCPAPVNYCCPAPGGAPSLSATLQCTSRPGLPALSWPTSSSKPSS